MNYTNITWTTTTFVPTNPQSITGFLRDNYPTEKTLHSYVRDRQNRKIGVFAAVTNSAYPNEVFIGWSRCNRNAGDRFDPILGARIAFDRSYRHKATDVPHSMQDDYWAFRTRCEKYFRAKNVA